MGFWLFIRTNQLPCFVLVKTCASVGSLTPKSSWERVFFVERRKLVFVEPSVVRYCARSIISFYLSSHLEGGKGDDTLQMRKCFPVKPVPKVVQLESDLGSWTEVLFQLLRFFSLHPAYLVCV